MIKIENSSKARLYFVVLVFFSSSLLLSSGGKLTDSEANSTMEPTAGTLSDAQDPTEVVRNTPTPKSIPFFIGPSDDLPSEGREEIPQSMPHEAMAALSESTPENTPESTPEGHPTETSEPEASRAEGEDQNISITTIEEPEEREFISDGNVFGYEYGEILEEHGLELMEEVGAGWVRRAGIWWPEVEPVKGSYDWETLEGFEKEFIQAYRSGLNVILIVRGAPDWAQADPPYNRTCGRIREDEFASFAKFMHALVEKYSYAPYHVKFWEIWNEPDVDPSLIPLGNEWMGCWGDMNDPYYGGGYYAELLKAVYPEVKSANPEAQVLVGGLLLDCDPIHVPEHKTDCTPSKFLEGILRNGGGDYFDGISFHAYDSNHSWLGGYYNSNWHSEADTTGPVLLAKVAYLKDLLERYQVSNKDLINTEAAVLCLYGELSVCEMTKAYYVVHSYISAYAVGLKANLWYFWMDRRAGLFKQDLTPLPSLETYSFAQDQLTNAAYSREVTDYMPSVRVYEFEREAGHMWVIWSMDGKRHILSIPSVPDRVRDAFGRTLTPRSSIEVDSLPLYIEWDD
jgi:hypothetical protein